MATSRNLELGASDSFVTIKHRANHQVPQRSSSRTDYSVIVRAAALGSGTRLPPRRQLQSTAGRAQRNRIYGTSPKGAGILSASRAVLRRAVMLEQEQAEGPALPSSPSPGVGVGNKDMASLAYWAQVANMCVTPLPEVEEFFRSTDVPGHDTEVLVKEVATVKQRMVLHINHDTKMITVAIRGTKNLTNMRSNLKVQQSSEFIGGVKVHRGFLEVAMELDQCIAPQLRSGYKIQLTGHSAGGVVAVLLAMHYDHVGFQIEQVVTFGAPKVGGLKVVRACAHLPIVRVADTNDVIPMLPTAKFRQGHSPKRYYHVGEAVILDENQPHVYSTLPRTEAQLLQKLDTVPSVMARLLKSDIEQLKSHKMARYVKTLRSLQDHGTEASPETLRGFALCSDVRSRRLVQIPTSATAEGEQIEQMPTGEDVAVDDANAGLVAVSLRKLSSRQRSRLREGIWKSAGALRLRVKERLFIPSLVARIVRR